MLISLIPITNLYHVGDHGIGDCWKGHLTLSDNNNNNIHISFSAPSFMFGKPNRTQRPETKSYAT